MGLGAKKDFTGNAIQGIGADLLNKAKKRQIVLGTHQNQRRICQTVIPTLQWKVSSCCWSLAKECQSALLHQTYICKCPLSEQGWWECNQGTFRAWEGIYDETLWRGDPSHQIGYSKKSQRWLIRVSNGINWKSKIMSSFTSELCTKTITRFMYYIVYIHFWIISGILKRNTLICKFS